MSSDSTSSMVERIDSLKPGQKADRMVAEAVLHWPLIAEGSPPTFRNGFTGCETAVGPGGWSPSTNANDAIAIVKHFQRQDFDVNIRFARGLVEPMEHHYWFAQIVFGQECAVEETLPLAICKMYLKWSARVNKEKEAANG